MLDMSPNQMSEFELSIMSKLRQPYFDSYIGSFTLSVDGQMRTIKEDYQLQKKPKENAEIIAST